jgi:Flp pilus assembly pilin Flp
MLNFIKEFRNDEDGAVTVDWVVLTAAIVALGLLVGNTVTKAAQNKTADNVC